MAMNTTTAAAPTRAALMPLSMDSWPREGPTVRSSSTDTGAGSEPARSTMARSVASWVVNWPVMTARPPAMRCWITGAE